MFILINIGILMDASNNSKCREQWKMDRHLINPAEWSLESTISQFHHPKEKLNELHLNKIRD